MRSVEVRMRLLAIPIAWLALCQPAAADNDRLLPRPEYDVLNHAMTHIEPGQEEYVESLPRRWAACATTAKRYAESDVPEYLEEARLIRVRCLDWAIERLAEIYYSERAFRSDGLRDTLHRVLLEATYFYWEVYRGAADCFERECGVENALIAPGNAIVSFRADLLELMALRTGRIRDVGAWRKAWIEAGELTF